MVYGKHWEKLSLEQYARNCALLMAYHGHVCPDDVDWRWFYHRMCVSDAAHWLIGDYGIIQEVS